MRQIRCYYIDSHGRCPIIVVDNLAKGQRPQTYYCDAHERYVAAFGPVDEIAKLDALWHEEPF